MAHRVATLPGDGIGPELMVPALEVLSAVGEVEFERHPFGGASDLCEYTVAEIERIARAAFGAARSRVSSVDKANVLETSRLWRAVVSRVHSQEFPHIELEHVLVDNAAMQLIGAPRQFEVILT